MGVPSEWLAVIDESGTSNVPGRSHEDDFAFGCLLVPVDVALRAAAYGTKFKELVGKGDPKYSDVAGSSNARQAYIDLMRDPDLGLRFTGFYVGGPGTVREAARLYRLASRADGRQLLRAFSRLVRCQDSKTAERLEAITGFMVLRLGVMAMLWNARFRICFDRRTDLPTIHSSSEEMLESLRDHPDLPDLGDQLIVEPRLRSELSGLLRIADIVAGDTREFFRSRGPDIWPALDPGGIQVPVAHYRAMEHELEANPNVCHRATVNIPLIPSHSKCMLGHCYKAMADRVMSFLSPDGIAGDIMVYHGNQWSIKQVPEIDHR